MFQKQQNLYQLQLSSNNFEFVTGSNIMNATVRQFTILGLNSCNLKEFPYFLRNQTGLERLEMSGNKIGGKVPNWMWNISKETLIFVDISDNFLLGELPVVIPWVNLLCLKLSNNSFRGLLPIPPPSVREYGANNNKFTGEISPLLCNMNSLRYLDLSKNNLSGTLPQCLRNFSDGLILLLLGSNSFHGLMPQSFNNRSSLRMIDVSHNQLQEQLPRSLANCVMLEYLVLSNNQFSDIFPIWLGTLPELKLLAMHHNEFYIEIGQSRTNIDFPRLRILGVGYDVNGFLVWRSVAYSITIAVKGLDLYYSKIQEGFAAIDISSNKFEGIRAPIDPQGVPSKGPVSSDQLLLRDPLPKCGNQEAPQPPSSTEEDSDSGSARMLGFDLIFFSAGIGSGFAVRVALADVAITRRQELFFMIVGMVRQMIWKR
ncbi:hypothetical protein L3X38_012915 [Prunus dulcis]|uniref:Receptor-like protein 12 n=1 Tax=Prunus dulcis TaxID=3755 RepID=A0AAD4ZH33_PRUDU|nr:hypothetical protein L3X38_012915 [Prunus dulcis]